MNDNAPDAVLNPDQGCQVDLRPLMLMREQGTDTLKRILYLNEALDLIYVIDIDKENTRAFPECASLSEIRSRIGQHDQYELVHSSDDTPPLSISLTPGQVSRRDRAWAAIADFIKPVPQCLDRTWFAHKLKEVAKNNKGTAPYLRRIFRQYWQGGMTKNALAGTYSRCGNSSSAKKIKELTQINKRKPKGEVSNSSTLSRHAKRGPKPVNGGPEGYTWCDDDIARFHAFAKKKFLSGDIKTIPALRLAFSREFFCAQDEHGDLLLFAPEERPTVRQVRTLVKQLFGLEALQKAKLGAIKFEQTLRGLQSDPMKGVSGPGTYQIDATLADYYIASMISKNCIVGRPLLYLITDVFSRCIVGFHVSLGNPSWIEAMAALYTTIQDRRTLFEMYGLDDDWNLFGPSGLCHVLVGDRAEIERHLPAGFTDDLGIDVENVPSYRADLKGCIETAMRWVPVNISEGTPGWVDTDHRERGGTDYRLDTTMNIIEFTRMIIRAIIKYNNRALTEYPMSPAMIAEGVIPNPINVFNWGVQKYGALKMPSLMDAFLALMPNASATVTDEAIVFRKLHYTAAHAVENDWFIKGRQARFKVTISYDPRNCRQIFIHVPFGSDRYIAANLTPRDIEWENCSFGEVDDHFGRLKKLEKQAIRHSEETIVNQAAKIEVLVDNAIAEKKATFDPTLSKREKTGNIKPNRKQEQMALGPMQSPLYKAAETAGMVVNNVLPLVLNNGADAMRQRLSKNNQSATGETTPPSLPARPMELQKQPVKSTLNELRQELIRGNDKK